MPGATPPLEQSSSKKKGRKKNVSGLLEWTDSLLSKDHVSLFSGNEGGFLSLEEIDESEYGLIEEVVEEVEEEKMSKKKKVFGSNKSKRGDEIANKLDSAAAASDEGDKKDQREYQQ